MLERALASQEFGRSFWRSGAVDLRFVSPLWVDDDARVLLLAGEQEDRRTVRCETRAGDRRLTSVGTASVDQHLPEWAEVAGPGS